MFAVTVFLSAVSYGEISFDVNPYVYPNSPDLDVDYDSSQADGYILVINQNGQAVNLMWHRFNSPAEIFHGLQIDDVFGREYVSQGNYQPGGISSLAEHFNLKESFEEYGRNGSFVYGSNRESFYVNEYKGNTLNRLSIDGFDDFTYEKSYDLNSLISGIYMVILIVLLLLVFSTVRTNMRFRSV
jgi:hypothetical protein